MSSEEGIKVFVRVRPLNEREKQVNRTCVEVDPEKNAVILVSRTDGRRQQFVYDKVADPSGSQSDVFETVGKPTSEYVLEGYNSTIFAYGQTGAGKTFTMQGVEDGVSCEDQSIRGLIPRVFEYLFSRIEELKAQNIQVVCKCSYLEIYNESVTDLLSDSAAPIVIRDDPRRGVVIEGAKELPVSTANDTLKALMLGSQNRKVADTCMNKESSRSHSVFTLYVQLRTQKDGVTTRKFARFNLIDLAGSERQKNTNATGDRLKEANNINRSLSALGNVIMALANANGHVPYRDSKLTFMLKDSIGGNSKTCIIACISPAESCHEETLSTLKFVRFAKLVKNVATINQDSSGDVKAMQHEIERLKALLRAANRPDSNKGSVSHDEGGLDSSELRAGDGVQQGSTPIEILLHQSLEREAEARAMLSNEKSITEEKLKLISAQEAFIQGSKMALRLKNGYIERLEKKLDITWPDQEAILKVELEEVRKQLHVNPALVRANIRIAELNRQIEELEEMLEESGAEAREGEKKRMQEEIEALGEGLRMTLSGKNATETRVEQLMEQLEDRQETIEHLQAVLTEHEYTSQSKDKLAQAAVDENNDLKVQLFEAREESVHLSNECKQLQADLLCSKSTATKLVDDLAQKTKELEALQLQFAEYKAHAESVVCDFETKLEASASKVEDLENALIDARKGAERGQDTESTLESLAKENEMLRASNNTQMLQEAYLKEQLESTALQLKQATLEHAALVAEREQELNDAKKTLSDQQEALQAASSNQLAIQSALKVAEEKIAELLASHDSFAAVKDGLEQELKYIQLQKEGAESRIQALVASADASERAKEDAEQRVVIAEVRLKESLEKLNDAVLRQQELEMELAANALKLDALNKLKESTATDQDQVQNDLCTLRVQYDLATNRISDLEASLTAAADSRRELEQQINVLRTEQECSECKIAEMLVSLEASTTTAIELQEQVQELQTLKQCLQGQIDEMSATILASERGRIDLEEELKGHLLDNEGATKKIEELQASLQSSRQEQKVAEDALNDLKPFMEVLEHEKKVAESKVSELQSSQAAAMTLFDSFSVLESSLSDSGESGPTVIEKASMCVAILNRIRNELEVLKRDEQILHDRIALQQSSIVQLNEEKQQLLAQISDLQAICDSKPQDYDSLRQSHDALLLQKAELDSQIATFMSSNDATATELVKLKETREILVAEKNAILAENSKLVSDQAVIEERLNQTLKLQRDLADQIEAASEALQSSEDARLAAEHRLESASSESEASRRRAEDLDAQVARMREEMSLALKQAAEGSLAADEVSSRVSELQDALTTHSARIAELTESNTALQGQLEEEGSKLREAQAAREMLAAELDRLRSELAEAESALEQNVLTNKQLAQTVHATAERLKEAENLLAKRTEEFEASTRIAAATHAAEVDRLRSELERTATELDNVTAQLEKQAGRTEALKADMAAAAQKLQRRLEQKERDLTETIAAAASLEKHKEELEVLLARTERAHRESEVAAAAVREALKHESAKLGEATAIRKQLEKHYLRQIEELLSSRVNNSQAGEKGQRRALSVLSGENASDQPPPNAGSAAVMGDRKTPIKARLRDRSRTSLLPAVDVCGSPGPCAEGIEEEGVDEAGGKMHRTSKARMQR